MLKAETLDLAKISNQSTKNIVFNKKPHNPIHDKVPVVLVQQGNTIINVILRSRPCMVYVTNITLQANQSKS